MPKLNFLTLPRKQPRTITKTYHEPGFAEPVTFTLQSLAEDPHGMVMALEQADALAAQYSENWLPHPGGDRPIQVTPRIAQDACVLAAMQAGTEEERHSPEEMIALAVTLPHVYTALLADVAELNAPAAQNGHRADGEDQGNA